MSLATSCTSCGTSFRVVQDQLKVSEGWVRCGKCGEVFNALEGLFDLERNGRPTPVTEPAAARQSPIEPALPSAPPDTLPEPERPDLARVDPEPTPTSAVGTAATASWMDALEPEPEVAPASHRDRPDFADARYDSAFDPDLVPPLRHESAPESDLPPEPPSEFAESMLADESAPAFVRHADRRARWHDPRVRAMLGAAALLLVLAAAGQIVHQRRDLIAATWPALRGPLFAWCGAVGCSIEPVRRIEDISVESTALTRSPAPDAYTLSVTLRNRGAIGLATPWVELTLKEGEQAFARRVLAPGDFRTPLAVLPAGAESNLQLLLSAGNPRVNGYSVEVFYP
ncbi:MAG: DUF3426 domain-containing protein [Burkholderiaceae bacterium]